MNTAQALTLKSELYEDWLMLLPVLQVVAIIMLIIAGVYLLRLVTRYVLVTILMIRGNKK